MNKKVTVKLLSLPISKGVSETYPYQEVFSCKFECLGKVLECNVQIKTNNNPQSEENYFDEENLFFVKSEINLQELGGHLCDSILKGIFNSYNIGDEYIIEFDEEGWII